LKVRLNKNLKNYLDRIKEFVLNEYGITINNASAIAFALTTTEIISEKAHNIATNFPSRINTSGQKISINLPARFTDDIKKALQLFAELFPDVDYFISTIIITRALSLPPQRRHKSLFWRLENQKKRKYRFTRRFGKEKDYIPGIGGE